MMHCTLMLVFSALLYWRGEQVALGYVISPPDWQVNAAMRPCCWQPSRPRGGARCGGHSAGAGCTWRNRAGDFRRTLCHHFHRRHADDLSGAARSAAGAGSLHYLALLDGDTTWGTVLLVWSCVVGTMDNVIRPSSSAWALTCR